MQTDGWFVESPEELAAVKDLDAVSDRAAAIVVATLVDLRLTLAIKSMLQQHEKIFDRMFRTSGPLGSFASKIDLALLMDLITQEAHRDLVNLKNIRNAFAHQLHAINFSSDHIKSLCHRFTLIEKQVGDIEGSDQPIKGPYSFYLHVSDYAKLIADPRGRYILTGRFFVAGLDPEMVSNQVTPWM
jgi:hypothetical protein